MDPAGVPFAPFAPPAAACQACRLHPDDLAHVTAHVEHVARALPALEQRQLRSHLFALLAVVTGTIDLAE